MLYYVVGFWLSFALVILASTNSNLNADNSSSAVAAAMVAIVWPIGLPLMVAVKINCALKKTNSENNQGNASDHGYPAA